MSAYSFALHTLGCKVNQYEGDKLADALIGLGMLQVGFDETADVYVVNGCTVTGTANHKARQLIRRAAKRNPLALIVVTGCYADGARDEIESQINGSGIVVGNALKAQVVEKVAARLGLSGGNEAVSTGLRHARPVVKVQDGCNNFCSYCIVPHVRGKLQSKPIEEVIEEVGSLSERGAKEIVLTGIHLGHYGADLRPTRRLDDLIAHLIRETDPRIRLSSLEMREVTESMIELAGTSNRLCPHFHLPLQSGSDKVLKAMNRRYSSDEFIDVCNRIKKTIPKVALTTDVIVGFPGETDDDFERTLDAVEAVGFSRVHAFRFSARPGTPAATMADQVDPHTKDERLNRLISLGDELSRKYAQLWLGDGLEVVAEVFEDGAWTGTSENYIRVGFAGPEEIYGRLVEVKAIEAQGNGIYGKLIEETENKRRETG